MEYTGCMTETEKVERSSPGELRWQAPEYAHYEKTPDWYWGLGIGAVALIGLAVYLNNLLFAFVIAIAAFTISLFAARKPDIVEYALTERGIKIDNRLYPYQSLQHFWVHEKEGQNDGRKLLLLSNKPLTPLMSIPVPDDIPTGDVRNSLLRFMQEEEIALPASHSLMELFRF